LHTSDVTGEKGECFCKVGMAALLQWVHIHHKALSMHAHARSYVNGDIS